MGRIWGVYKALKAEVHMIGAAYQASICFHGKALEIQGCLGFWVLAAGTMDPEAGGSERMVGQGLSGRAVELGFVMLTAS